MTRALAITLLLFAALLAVAALRYAPPSPLAADSAADRFSAMRAREVQRVISESGAPRDIGSEASEKARGYLEGELAKSGFHTEIQRALSCTRHGACAFVANIVATLPGRDPAAGAVLLMAHYDSVPCGPGASDDGVGTATAIETARALSAAPPLARTVIVVLTDGEESGLLGADAFVRSHPLAANVTGVVNVDARGSSGPSAMFETSPGNAWIVGLFARNVDRPVTSSLFYEIYRRMPNDTDFTVLKDRVQGVNLANIARVEHYHTPLDSFANADPGTLQHHGDQALAMVRALGEAGPELDGPAAHGTRGLDAVWFDVMALFVVRFPAAAALGLALAAFALVLGWTIRARAWGTALLAPLAALLAALVSAAAVGAALRALGAIPVPWLAHPLFAEISLHGTCIVAGLTAARFVARGARVEVLWAGTWLTWGALGVLTAAFVPGASFLFVVPTLVAGFAFWLRVELAAALPALAAAVLWLPITLLAYDGLGLFVPVLACLPSVVLVSSLPALAAAPNVDGGVDAAGDAASRKRRFLALAGALSVLIAAVAALLAPKFSAAVPQRVNVVLRQDTPLDGSAPPAHVYVEAAWASTAWGAPPVSMVRALGDSSQVRAEAPLPWSSIVPYAQAPRVEALIPPRAIPVPSPGGDRSTLHLKLESPRGARTIVLVLPPGESFDVTVQGTHAFPRYGAVILRGIPATGVEVSVRSLTKRPIELTVFDVTSGLPSVDVAATANAVLAARAELHTATQTQEGDVTIAARRFAF